MSRRLHGRLKLGDPNCTFCTRGDITFNIRPSGGVQVTQKLSLSPSLNQLSTRATLGFETIQSLNAYKTYLNYGSNDQEKPANYSRPHSVGQHRPDIPSQIYSWAKEMPSYSHGDAAISITSQWQSWKVKEKNMNNIFSGKVQWKVALNTNSTLAVSIQVLGMRE